MKRAFFLSLLLATPIALSPGFLSAADWPQFRGPGGNGIGDAAAPVAWSENENIKWKADIPGNGISSPIIVGNRVYVTYWDGYGLDARDPGDQENLKRNLACLDRASGEMIWTKSVKAALPEDRYGGMLTQHGYASHTPVSDGKMIYAFFGKTGVVAFNMEGDQVWQRAVGEWTDRRGWGSSASPILYKNILIVNAAIEDGALYGLDKTTGEVVWKQEASSLYSIWSTPALVELEDGQTDLVVPVPYEVWGLNPETGKLRWYVTGLQDDSQCSTPVVKGDAVYLIAGRGAGSIAIRAGGKGDVTESHVLWRSRSGGRIASPVIRDEKMFWVNDGIAYCVDLKTGEEVYRARLEEGAAASPAENRPVQVVSNSSELPLIAQAQQERQGPPEGEGRGRGGFGGGFGGGRMGGQDYASPVAAGGKMYFLKRDGRCAVIELGDDFKQVATNKLGDGSAIFHATPAIAGGEIFIRSTTHLYCIGEADAPK